MMTNAPVGRTSAYAELLHPAALVSVHRLITFFRPGYPLSASAFWLPVIVATLGVIPAFAVGRRLAGNLGGVFAAVLVGVDATVLRRTVGTGKGDKSRFRRPLVPRVWEPNVTPLVDLTGQPVRAPTLPQTGLQP
jgi:asparagine N-glycosylation enzyme membrane subunit Stt3